MKDGITAQHCIKCGQVKLPSDYWTQKITYWQELAIANRKVAEDNQTKLAAVTKRKDECSNGWDEALAQRDKASNDALEEAAKVCDEYANSGVTGAMVFAAAIRAMKVEK